MLYLRRLILRISPLPGQLLAHLLLPAIARVSRAVVTHFSQKISPFASSFVGPCNQVRLQYTFIGPLRIVLTMQFKISRAIHTHTHTHVSLSLSPFSSSKPIPDFPTLSTRVTCLGADYITSLITSTLSIFAYFVQQTFTCVFDLADVI